MTTTEVRGNKAPRSGPCDQVQSSSEYSKVGVPVTFS
jgi:hypothetical protein